jgi:competence protein ComEC
MSTFISSVISFFLGIISLHIFRELPSLYFVMIIVVVLIGISFIPQCRKYKKYKQKLFLAYFTGFLWVLLHAKSVIDHRIPDNIEAKPINVVGIVDSIPEHRDNTTRFDFDIQHSLPKSLWSNPGRVKLRLRNPSFPLQVGDQLQLTVKLKRPHGYANPGSFDTERHLFQHRIVAEGTVVNKSGRQGGAAPIKISDSLFSHPIDRLRMWLLDKINHVLNNSEYLGIIDALVVGVQSNITSEQWKVLKETGTVHLVAIAGLHIAFVTGFAMWVILWIWQQFFMRSLGVQFLKMPVSLITAVGGLCVAFFYAALAGFSIPTQRAVVVIVAFMVSILSKRHGSVWQNYFLALFIVLLLDPLSTLAPGFWLSFGAVGLILYGMKGRIQPEGLWWKWGRIQWVLFLGLTPIMLAIFGMTSLIAPLANFIAIPWVGFLVLPFCLLGSLCVTINATLGGFFLKIASGSLALLWPILRWFSGVTMATWANATQPLWILLIGFIGVLLILLPKGFPGKNIGFIFLLPIFLNKPSSIDLNAALVTVLDVGQGLALVIETQNHVLVFDTGPKLNAGFDTGDRVVVPFLATRGRNNIDTLVISHGDNDHSGGARSILKAVNVKTIMTSEPKLFPEYNTVSCFAGQHWAWDGVRFEILHPISVFTKKRNDHSCVLKVTAGTQSVLLTADIEAKSEYSMLENLPEKLPATVMLVPHHGSRTSSTLEFIHAVNPQIAIIPVGYLNQYGHPKPAIVERYKKENIMLLDTVNQGAISFILNNRETVDIHAYREENQRYWHELINK